MRRPPSVAILASATLACLCGLAACSSARQGSSGIVVASLPAAPSVPSGPPSTTPAGATPPSTTPPTTPKPPPTLTKITDCTFGNTTSSPGVVKIYCNGTADVTYTVGGATREMTGGTCSISSTNALVVDIGPEIDTEDTSFGKYTGKPWDFVGAVDDPAGGPTVEMYVQGKEYPSETTISAEVAEDGTTAHFTGKSDNSGKNPGVSFTIDVTC